MSIHSTAVIDPKAQLDKDVHVGPYCVIGPNVTLKKGVKLHSHVVIEGYTTVGEGTEVFPFACFHIPQDLKYKGEKSTLIIGKNNIIREYVTLQPGTAGDKMTTVIGDNNLFMASSHVAHDCVIGNHVQLANNATLAGHVTVEDNAIVGGLAAIHQNIRIGHHAIIGGLSGVVHDVIPYGTVKGDRAYLVGLNIIGMKRGGVSREDINTLQEVYGSLFNEVGNFSDRLSKVSKEYKQHNRVMELIDFIEDKSSRSICLPKHV